MMTGALLLILGLVGLVLRRRSVEASPTDSSIDPEPFEPEAELTEVEAYHRAAKEKRRDRWAETFDEEPLDAQPKK